MKRLFAPSVAMLVAAAGAIGIAAEIESGPAPGSPAGAFNSKDITGPNKGKSLCYR